MIELWSLFDAAFLSKNKAEIVYKLIRNVNFKMPNQERLNIY